MCVIRFSEETAIISPKSIKRLMLVVETLRVFCAVGAHLLNVAYANLRLQPPRAVRE
jgi:hypothetical protein